MHCHSEIEQVIHPAQPWVLLAGQPNVGKSVLFKQLTGRYVSVSNYPSTTVEVTRGQITVGATQLGVVDAPGLNSLQPHCTGRRHGTGARSARGPGHLYRAPEHAATSDGQPRAQTRVIATPRHVSRVHIAQGGRMRTRLPGISDAAAWLARRRRPTAAIRRCAKGQTPRYQGRRAGSTYHSSPNNTRIFTWGG